MPMMPAAGSTIAGCYQLIEPLGQGGMGSVWLAVVIATTSKGQTTLQPGTEVAIKLLSPELAASVDVCKRFQAEAQAPQTVRSPHVVQTLDHGVDGHAPYIVMERLHGEDFSEYLQHKGRLSAEEAAMFFTQICAGLHAAHQAGIVHRDLKPGNIFLAKLPGGGEFAKILDFGIAKIQRTDPDSEATRTGEIMGSLNYMSPEQLKNSKSVDHRSDLWSLAVLLLRAVTGKIPFPGTELADLVLRVCMGPIPLPSTLAPELALGPHWDEFFRIALDRNRDARFQSALEVAMALDRVVRGLSPRPGMERTLPLPPRSVRDVRRWQQPPPSSHSFTGPFSQRASYEPRASMPLIQSQTDDGIEPPTVATAESWANTSVPRKPVGSLGSPWLRSALVGGLAAGLVGIGVIFTAIMTGAESTSLIAQRVNARAVQLAMEASKADVLALTTADPTKPDDLTIAVASAPTTKASTGKDTEKPQENQGSHEPKKKMASPANKVTPTGAVNTSQGAPSKETPRKTDIDDID